MSPDFVIGFGRQAIELSAENEKQRFTRSGNLYGGTPPRSHLLRSKRPWASGPLSPRTLTLFPGRPSHLHGRADGIWQDRPYRS